MYLELWFQERVCMRRATPFGDVQFFLVVVEALLARSWWAIEQPLPAHFAQTSRSPR